MKKNLIFSILAILVVFGVTMVVPQEVFAKKDLRAGSVIKGKGLSSLYYLGEDGKRYVFPNDKTYFSWFDDFSNVEEIELEDLYEYNLGGNARYKPGKLLIKITTDPKVYAVSADGILHWNKMIDDIPDSFFTNYTIGDPIETEDDFNPDEEEEQVPTISHNRGLKVKEKIQNRIQNALEKRCKYLTNAVNRLQKRAAQWGFEVSSLGDDYISECAQEDTTVTDHKITICHKGQTLSVARAALSGHIKHGDYLGACTNNNNTDNQDDSDETIPVISDISANPQINSAIISWTTNEKADSAVEYAIENISGAGTTTKINDGIKTTSHSIELTGLTAETTYYYIIKSTDEAGNITTSGEYFFTTKTEADITAPEITDIIASTTPETATVTWTTNETATSKLIYSVEPLNTASSSIVNETESVSLTTSHSLSITGLSALTEYFFKVISVDAANNSTESAENSFTTTE